jgi:hypothetical protein
MICGFLYLLEAFPLLPDGRLLDTGVVKIERRLLKVFTELETQYFADNYGFFTLNTKFD